MPYERKYRKPKVKGISAKAIQVVQEDGLAPVVLPNVVGIGKVDADRRHRPGHRPRRLGSHRT